MRVRAWVDWDSAVRFILIREKKATKDDTPKDGSIIEVDGYLVPNDTNIVIVKAKKVRL